MVLGKREVHSHMIKLKLGPYKLRGEAQLEVELECAKLGVREIINDVKKLGGKWEPWA